MSKVFTLVFVALVLSYVFLVLNLKDVDSDGVVNRELRPVLTKSAFYKSVFFLNSPGDARYDFFSSDKPTVLVEVDYQKGFEPNENLEDWIKSLFSETVGKEVLFEISQEEKIEGVRGFSDSELVSLSKSTRDFSGDSKQGYLHILYVSESEDYPSNTGLVLTANDFFIFRKGVDRLTDQKQARARVEESTIKHEFGHLLGLEHVERGDCVMSEQVEVYENERLQFGNIPLEFCAESKFAMERMRKKV